MDVVATLRFAWKASILIAGITGISAESISISWDTVVATVAAKFRFSLAPAKHYGDFYIFSRRPDFSEFVKLVINKSVKNIVCLCYFPAENIGMLQCSSNIQKNNTD